MLARRAKQFIPFILLLLLLGLLWHELFSKTSTEPSTAMLGETVPTFSLPTLANAKKMFSSDELRGKVCILNVWASWCSACVMEHNMLMKIKNKYHVPIYGIVYKDEARDALQLLAKKGNPYVTIGTDSTGDTAIDLGIYGTPESFVLNPQGKILYRQIGMIDEETWTKTIYPIIKQYEKIPR